MTQAKTTPVCDESKPGRPKKATKNSVGKLSSSKKTGPCVLHFEDNDPLRYFMTGYYVNRGVITNGEYGERKDINPGNFPFLHDLFVRCGVSQPNLEFAQNNSIPKYRAGHQGYVYCRFKEGKSSASIFSPAFPATSTSYADLRRLQNFFPDVNQEPYTTWFHLFFLGFISSSGCLIHHFGGSPGDVHVRHTQWQGRHRDIDFLHWVQKKAEGVGYKIRIQRPPQYTRQYVMVVGTTTGNKAAFRYGMSLMRKYKIPIHGNLALVERASYGVLAFNDLPQRSSSFGEYVAKCIDDPVARVVAQDTYVLNLCSLNHLICHVGYSEKGIRSIYDFDLQSFVAYMRDTAEQPECIQKNYLLLRYWHSCKARVILHAQIADIRHCKPFATVCPICSKPMLNINAVKRHALVHKSFPAKCDYNDDCNVLCHNPHQWQQHRLLHTSMEYPWKCRQRRCRAKFKSELQLTKHCNEMHNEFDSDQAPVMCPYAGCNRSFKSTDLQIDHLFLVHKPPQKGKENVCAWPDCGKEFGYHYNLWTHVRNKHIREKNPKIECEAEGCDRTFIDKQSYSCHFRKFHPENLVSCDICYSVTSCPLKVNEHKQRFHNPLNTFVCTYCSKRYSAKAGLLLHQRKACRLANKKQ